MCCAYEQEILAPTSIVYSLSRVSAIMILELPVCLPLLSRPNPPLTYRAQLCARFQHRPSLRMLEIRLLVSKP
jgi:hypothetical protein